MGIKICDKCKNCANLGVTKYERRTTKYCRKRYELFGNDITGAILMLELMNSHEKMLECKHYKRAW